MSKFVRAIVHSTAHVHPSARLGAGVIVSSRAYIGPRCVLHPGVRIGAGVHLGQSTVIGANSSIENGRVGERCLFHSGVRIGGDGFGFMIDEGGAVIKKPQLLRVLIGDDVEIGANTCIDRGSWRETIIGALSPATRNTLTRCCTLYAASTG